MPESSIIHWAFLDREVEVYMLSDKVAYSWTCQEQNDSIHSHSINCLWIWHDCDRNLDPPGDHWTDIYTGWKPTGVGLHDLISSDPLHIEASIYWPKCCGMHGWIRDGKYIDV